MTILYRRDHFPMFLSRLLEVARIGQAIETYAVGAQRELTNRVRQISIAGLREQQLVEVDVGVKHHTELAANDRRVMDDLSFLEILDIHLRERHRDQAGAVTLQQMPEHVELLDLVRPVG